MQVGISQTKNALFIGNSFTLNYNMPKKLERIARAQGFSLYTEQATKGGMDWKYHATNPKTYKKIKAEPWDYVILQGKSYEPLYPDSTVEKTTLTYGQQMIDSIRYYHPNAKIMLFMTWGYKNGMFLDYEEREIDYTEMQNMLYDKYMDFADSYEVAVAPVGFIWKEALDKFEDINLYYKDNYHQNEYGSFLVASTIFSMMFESTVNNYDNFPYQIEEKKARNIATLASNVVLDPKRNWRKLYWLDKEFELMSYSFVDHKIFLSTTLPDIYLTKWKINGKTVSKNSEIELPYNNKFRKIRLIAREGILRRPREETMIITAQNRVGKL
jgi:hypothetical protein